MLVLALAGQLLQKCNWNNRLIINNRGRPAVWIIVPLYSICLCTVLDGKPQKWKKHCLKGTWHWDDSSEYVVDEWDLWAIPQCPKGQARLSSYCTMTWTSLIQCHQESALFLSLFRNWRVSNTQFRSLPIAIVTKPCHHGYSKINAKTCKIHWQFNKKNISDHGYGRWVQNFLLACGWHGTQDLGRCCSSATCFP